MAPGENIRSSVPGGGYESGWSGTSMSGPHVTGLIGLMWSACPSLRGQVDLTDQMIKETANPLAYQYGSNCGGDYITGPNNDWGMGTIDAQAAVQAAIIYCGGAEYGLLTGHVYDQTGAPLAGASVMVSPGNKGDQIDAIADPNGAYTMTLLIGTYDVIAQKSHYFPQSISGIQIQNNQTTIQDFTLAYKGTWTEMELPPGCPDWYRTDMEYYPATGLAYIMGGRSSSTVTEGTIYSYNPIGNTCTDTGLTMPVPIGNYTILTLNNGETDLLCTFGGYNTSTGYTNAVQCFNPIANTISIVSTLPGQLGHYIPGGAAVVDNNAYLFGGYRYPTPPRNNDETWAWNPITNTWTQKGNLSLARGFIEVGVFDGKIYAFGGLTAVGDGFPSQSIAEVLDPSTGIWDDSSILDLPIPSSYGRAFSFEINSGYELAGKIILAGGGISTAGTDAVIAYDVASNSYEETLPDLNFARWAHAGLFIPGNPGHMYVWGGMRFGSEEPPYAPPEYLAVNLEAPKISISPTSISTSLLPDSIITIPITISNVGTLPLNWNITSDANWLTENPISGTVPISGAVKIDAIFDSADLTAGVYTTTLVVNSNDPATPVVNVPITLNVLSQSDLTLAMSANVDNARVGDTITYTLIITNNGPQDDTGVLVTDTLPVNGIFSGASPGCLESMGVVTCDIGNLGSGMNVHIIIAVKAEEVSIATNSAEVTANNFDPNPNNNYAKVEIPINPAILDFYLPVTQKH
jgi:uncharacterized repeat protein (TIGR01451 family)